MSALSFASCDDISKLFIRMFPCTISSNFSLSRAKVSQNHPGLLPFLSCNMHVVHNAFKAGLTVYGSEAEEMAFDLHQWFKSSPCKREDFLKLEENTQLDSSLFYRHVSSTWWTLLPALERVLEMWDLSRK